MNPSLNLIFFKLYQMKVEKYKLSFQENIEDIKIGGLHIFLPEKIFEHGKDKATISITLYDKTNLNTFLFNIYYGNNIAYVQTDVLSRHVYEFIFKDINTPNIKEDKYEFKELDNLGNNNRKRLTLINYKSDNIEIKGIDLSLSAIISENTLESEITFNQISVLDLINQIFIIQPIREKNEYDIKFFENNKDKLIEFEKDFNIFLKKNKYDYMAYGVKLEEKYGVMDEHGSLDLNRDINYLNDIFGNNSFLEVELFWNYSLCRFFIDNDKTKIFEKKSVIQAFIKKLTEIKNKIKDEKERKDIKNETDNELPLYEKFRTIYTLFTILFMKANPFEEVNEIENLNIRYVITSQKENNSIMDKTYKFYNKFVDSLTEDSAIFPYLLYVDGGSGYYKKDDVYTFDLKNLDMLKTHLKQVFPKVIIFCYINKGEEALTESEFGGIVLNEFYITEKKFIDYNTDKLIDITEEEKDDIAMSLFLYLFHEASGHKKYALSEKENISPKKIFNKANKIIKLEYQNDYVLNEDNCEYILKSKRNPKKGDSGHFLELCYGKYDNTLIIEILRKMKNKGKLINYPELFTDNGKKLNEYVSLRKQIEENNIIIDFKYEISIDDEIKQMKSELEKVKQSNPNNKIEIFKEQISTEDKMDKNILNKGKRNRNDIKLEKDDFECDINENKGKKYTKEYTLNFIKSNNNTEKEVIKDEKFNEDIKENEKKYLTREERINYAIKRVGEKFNIYPGALWKQNLIKIKKEISINDPYYYDISLLLR